ncbi:MAG: ABC transporter ATP-binding protein [Candidatus Hydrogenedentes bacterium]|nr:ABC transporter ATP-binding protein [Candidatus Hydrogenedentota bacterium]
MGSLPILEIERLSIVINTGGEKVYPVQDISCRVYKGDRIGIVGESGSGKSIFALSIGNLLTPGVFSVKAEKFRFLDYNLLNLSESSWQKIRGTHIGYVFQESLVSLNPHLTVGTQLTEHLVAHRGVSKKDAQKSAVDILAKLQLSDPISRMKMYPHQLSGGMRQRIAIAMALMLTPTLIIADEPTTALDATLQVQIVNLLNIISREYGSSVIFITHDLSLLANFSSHIWVMYGGKILETAPVECLYREPLHPYTKILISIRHNLEEKKILKTIPGSPPDMKTLYPGCPFYDRCRFAKEECNNSAVSLVELLPNHYTACTLVQKGEITL